MTTTNTITLPAGTEWLDDEWEGGTRVFRFPARHVELDEQRMGFHPARIEVCGTMHTDGAVDWSVHLDSGTEEITLTPAQARAVARQLIAATDDCQTEVRA